MLQYPPPTAVEKNSNLLHQRTSPELQTCSEHRRSVAPLGSAPRGSRRGPLSNRVRISPPEYDQRPRPSRSRTAFPSGSGIFDGRALSAFDPMFSILVAVAQAGLVVGAIEVVTGGCPRPGVPNVTRQFPPVPDYYQRLRRSENIDESLYSRLRGRFPRLKPFCRPWPEEHATGPTVDPQPSSSATRSTLDCGPGADPSGFARLDAIIVPTLRSALTPADSGLAASEAHCSTIVCPLARTP